jgi:hypothetical protein
MSFEVTSITPTFFYYQDGEISRSLNRLNFHLHSISNQANVTIRKIVVDQSEDIDIIAALRNICKKHNAEYYNIKTSLVFNKALLVNYGLHLTESEHVAIMDLDLVFQKDVFKMCLDKSKENNSLCNTRVYYLDELDDYHRLDLNSYFFDMTDIPGRLRAPQEKGLGIQGGIQMVKTSIIRDELLGLNTNINLLGGYDNDPVCRMQKAGYKTEEFSEKGIRTVHIPHVKYQNLRNLFSLKELKIIKIINANIAYHKSPKSFIYKEEDVFGVRYIDGKLYYGKEKGDLLTFDDDSTFIKVTKLLD